MEKKRKRQCELCNTRASFGRLSDGIKVRCSRHKTNEMDDLVHKKCELCDTRASFGLSSDGIKVRCSRHKTNEMDDLINKRCELCNTQATFGLPSDGIRVRCSRHKTNEMDGLVNKRCELCNTRATFGLLSDGIKVRCSRHKTNEMDDLVHKKCELCNSVATFGHLSDGILLRCGKHKTDKMDNLVSKRCERCTKQAVGGKYCLTHGGGHPCPSCHLKSARKGLCGYCRDPSMNRLKKQKEVAELLKSNNISYISEDKAVGGLCCSRKRPDFLLQGISSYVVVEVDENEHQTYLAECEIARMSHIQETLNGPVHFIRYNPDAKGVRKMEKHRQLVACIQNALGRTSVTPLSYEFLFYSEARRGEFELSDYQEHPKRGASDI